MAGFRKFTPAIAIGLLLSLSVVSCYNYPGAPDTTLVSEICNGQQDEQYDLAIGYVHMHLVTETPVKGFNYYVTSPWNDHIIFGHAACNGKLDPMNCDVCLSTAFDQLHHDCPPLTTGAQVQLQDCRIRYETYPFIE